MATLAQVAAFAIEAHAGQVDKIGRDYVNHHVVPVVAKTAEYAYKYRPRADGERLVQLAWLHDVVEDTEVVYPDLEALVGYEMTQQVRLLTRNPGVPYATYIVALSMDPSARLVKLADNAVNLVNPPGRLQQRYEQARGLLIDAEGQAI